MPLSEIDRLLEENSVLVELLTNIVSNAVLQPDARIKGATDVYAVPIEDIEFSRVVLLRRKVRR